MSYYKKLKCTLVDLYDLDMIMWVRVEYFILYD
jgi:hypothetical protein